MPSLFFHDVLCFYDEVFSHCNGFEAVLTPFLFISCFFLIKKGPDVMLPMLPTAASAVVQRGGEGFRRFLFHFFFSYAFKRNRTAGLLPFLCFAKDLFWPTAFLIFFLHSRKIGRNTFQGLRGGVRPSGQL